MKTVFALLDENGKVIKTSDSISDIVYCKEQLKNRRTGKSTRAILTALGSKCSVYIIHPNRNMAKNNHRTASIYLDMLEFEYEKYTMSLEIKPKLSGSIYFTTAEDFRSMKIDSSTEFVIIEDN